MKHCTIHLQTWIPVLISLGLVAVLDCVAPGVATGQDAKQTERQTIRQDTWGSFRNGGRSEVVNATAIPKKWSPTEGIQWRAELPGYGQSSPVLLGDEVIITSVDGPQKEQNVVVCLSRSTGKAKWTVSKASSRPGPSNYMFSRAAPTPLVDSKHVLAFFESGDLMAIDRENGEVVWARNLADDVGPLNSRHGIGSSLAQSKHHLFVNLEHDGPSALFAIEKANGETVWKVDRPSGSSWSSPIVFAQGDAEQVVVTSQGEAIGLNASTGEQLWKVNGLNGNTVSSPAVDGDRIFLGARKPEFGSAEEAAKSNLCLEFDADDASPIVKWRSERCLADYASPVVCGDYLYLINQSGILGCLDKATGREIYRQRLGYECWATPISAGGHLYVFGKNGVTTVVQPGDTFEKVRENHLWNPDDPPTPIAYREFFPPREKAHSHGNRHDSDEPSRGGHTDHTSKRDTPGASMVAGLLRADQDGDGHLGGDEIPKRLASAMESIDLNHDGMLDKAELTQMAEKFAARRQGSRESSRDPIVYGVAADSKGILVRTGTRLYSLAGEN